MKSPESIVLYRSKDGEIALDVQLENEAVWRSQKQMADLFAKDSDTIGLHVRNIYTEGELLESKTTEESSVVCLVVTPSYAISKSCRGGSLSS